MKILAVDTAEQSCSIALVEDQMPICESFHLNRMTHSRTLMDMVVHMVEKRAELTIDDVDGFVVTCGPGSFTGLRIGISVVKGLACATSKPSAGISSLDAIASQFSFSSAPICVMMDAKRGEVYSALYNFTNGRLIEKSQEVVVSPEDAVAIATLHRFTSAASEEKLSRVNGSIVKITPYRPAEAEKGLSDQVLFVGSGAVAFRPMIQKLMGEFALFAPPFQNFVRASSLASMLFEDTTMLSLSHDAITPVYIRRSDAEMNYERQHQRFC